MARSASSDRNIGRIEAAALWQKLTLYQVMAYDGKVFTVIDSFGIESDVKACRQLGLVAS